MPRTTFEWLSTGREMKLGSATLLNKCAAGVKLPARGPCPECGASSGEPCYKKSRQDAELLDRLTAENERLREEKQAATALANYAGARIKELEAALEEIANDTDEEATGLAARKALNIHYRSEAE